MNRDNKAFNAAVGSIETMRIVKYLSIGLILCLAMVLAPWLLNFSGSTGFSSSPDDWAHFGGYIGGTLSSLVAALALVALLYTISQQHRQIEILRVQSSKEDILSSIERLERDLERVLEGVTVNITSDDGIHSASVRDILFKPSTMGFQQALPKEQDILKQSKNNQDNPDYLAKLTLFEVIGLAAAELNQIRLYAEGLKQLESRSGTSILARYYHRKYKLAYSRLYEHGSLKEKWEFET